MLAINSVSSFPNVYISNVNWGKVMTPIRTDRLFKLKTCTVKNLYLDSCIGFVFEECIRNQEFLVLQYGVQFEAYLVYKLIENTGMIESLENINFLNFIQIDLQDLNKLITKYRTKRKINESINLVSLSRDKSISSIVQFFYQYYSKLEELMKYFKKIALLDLNNRLERSSNYDKWSKLSEEILVSKVIK